MEEIPILGEIANLEPTQSEADDRVQDVPPMTISVWLKEPKNAKPIVLQPGWSFTPLHVMGQIVSGSPFMELIPHDNVSKARLTHVAEAEADESPES